jgi:hypothetical protein
MYDLTYESPGYDPSINSFSKKEAYIVDSWGRLKFQWDSHPKWRQVCTLHQKELEIENMSVAFSDTSANLQDLYVVLDYNVLIT